MKLSSFRYFLSFYFFSPLSTQFCANFALEIWLERRLTYPFLCESHSREGRSAQDRRNHWNCKTNRGNQKLYVSKSEIHFNWLKYFSKLPIYFAFVHVLLVRGLHPCTIYKMHCSWELHNLNHVMFTLLHFSWLDYSLD